jgi:hypothetical protein
VNRLGHLILEPLHRNVNIALAVREQQVCVGSFDRSSRNPPIRFAAAARNRIGHNQLHHHIEPYGRMLLTLLGHPSPHWIARVQRVRFDESQFRVPSLRPMPPLIPGQPKPEPRNHNMIPQRPRHARHDNTPPIKPRPLVADCALPQHSRHALNNVAQKSLLKLAPQSATFDPAIVRFDL